MKCNQFMFKRMACIIMLLSLLLLNTVCKSELTADKKRICEQFTSIFENDSTDLQYGYCENINDGRGFTSGRAGFCTGTGDALQVIQLYTSYQPINPLAKYLPELQRLAKLFSGDVSKLSGYCTTWQQASADHIFRLSQDTINDQLYYRPAMDAANRINLTTVLAKCLFYDTIIQHGAGTDHNSFGALIKKTQKAISNTVTLDNEWPWILKFLEERRRSLQYGFNTSVDRIDAMVQLINQTNWNMDPPMHIKTRHHDKIIE